MPNITQLRKDALEAREHGKIDDALILLKKAVKHTNYSMEMAEIKSEMAICYQRLGKTKHAVQLYESAMDDFVLHGDVVGVARVRKNIAMLYLIHGKSDEANELAMRARNAVVSSGIRPVDLCHLTHGVVETLLVRRQEQGPSSWLANTKEIVGWTYQELCEFRSAAGRVDSIERHVWKANLMMDICDVSPILLWPFGLYAMGITVFHDLKLENTQPNSNI